MKINANEVTSGADPKLSLEILSKSKDVQNFFKANESSLTSLLTDKGFSLSSFKISNSSNDGLSKDLDMSNGEKSFSGQHQSKKEGENQHSQRRANLWQQYQEKLGA